VDDHREEFGHSFLTGAEGTRNITPEKYGKSQRIRAKLVNQLWHFFENYDLLLTPTLPVEAIDARGAWPTRIAGRELKNPLHVVAFTPPFNLSGHPAASVRAGFSDSGLPVGLQIVGGRHRDDLVLQTSYAYEQARPWNDRWPQKVPAFAG
jgi:Asp-tRNA(Asn)/Glu-tRNA(Gln) amidotransferase A subunit family amidase